MTQFCLQKWNENFIKDIAVCADNPNVAANLRNVFPNPYTLKDAEEYVHMCMDADPKQQCTRAIVVHGKAVGSVGTFKQNDVYEKNAELGYWLAEEYWRQGIMSEAVRQIVLLTFDTLDVVRIYAEPYDYNKGSCGVLIKNGFTLEGEFRNNVYKNGVFHNTKVFSILKDEIEVELRK